MLKKIKNSTELKILNSFEEHLHKNSFNSMCNKYKILFKYFFNNVVFDMLKREEANCVYKDMLHLTIT